MTPPIRLRRSATGRAAGSVVQFLLFLGVIATVALVVGQFSGVARDLVADAPWSQFVLPPVLALFWLRSATGWAEVDDHGIHWRQFRRVDVDWHAVEAVTLGRTHEIGQSRFATYPAVIVRRRRDAGRVVATRDPATGALEPRTAVARRRSPVLGPPLARGRQVREFGAAVAGVAARHGVTVQVTDDGWGLPLTPGDPLA